MNHESIIDSNRKYWNEHADLWFGTTALPEYGVKFVTENDLHLFKDVAGKKYWKYAAEAATRSNILETEMPPSFGAWHRGYER